ncbi:MAG: MFS transporter [Myxococcota bacterium]
MARALALAVFLVTGAVNLQVPLYATYASGAGLGAGAMSLLLAGYVGALLPSLVLLGGISDRIGRRPSVLGALGCSLAATLLVLAFPGAVGLAPARWLQGFGVALVMGASTAWIAETEGPDLASRVTGWSSTAGFGSGALLTSIAQATTPSDRPWTYAAWCVAILGSAVWIGLSAAPPPADARARLLRLPTFPPGSGIPALSILLGWSVAGIVVAVLPGVLGRAGYDAWSGVVLFALLAGGFLAQIPARRLDAGRAMQVGAALLPCGVALLALGVAVGSVGVVLLGAALAGTSTHGYGYLGGLRRVAALEGSSARNVSGYFVFAYLGFGVPAVSMGVLVDRVGGTGAFALLAALCGMGGIALFRSATRTS